MRKPRAIICDDDALIRDLFRQVLESMGYEVITAETPLACAFYREKAGSCPQHHRCTDILITDHNMPRMTGLELLHTQIHGGCRLTGRNKALVTGSDDPELRKEVEALGCTYFVKPVPLADVISWVKGCETRFDLAEPLAEELVLPATEGSDDTNPS